MKLPPGVVIPPEPDLPCRTWYPELEHHATALGYVCFTYSSLELAINQYVETLLPCSHDARRAIVDASGVTLATRCELVLKLASLRDPPAIWFCDLEALLKRVRDELAPERNRLIHDVWLSGGGDIKQWDQRAFLRRAQAGEPKRIAPSAAPERSLPVIWDLVRRIQEVNVHLLMVWFTFLEWQETGRSPEASELPDEVRRGPAPNAPRQETTKKNGSPPRS
jgi:hypothetical protein